MKTMTYGQAAREHYASQWVSSGCGIPFEDYMRSIGISLVSRFTALTQQPKPTQQASTVPAQPLTEQKQISLFDNAAVTEQSQPQQIPPTTPPLSRKKADVDGRIHNHRSGRNWEKIPGRHEFVETPHDD